jgi:hypothetical protein
MYLLCTYYIIIAEGYFRYEIRRSIVTVVTGNFTHIVTVVISHLGIPTGVDLSSFVCNGYASEPWCDEQPRRRRCSCEDRSRGTESGATEEQGGAAGAEGEILSEPMLHWGGKE